uniref:Secreted protein n=1 Tax=Heterorhabditis bacteriophora TaxID=37862 RepID=A0A1I7WAS9_HETBA
MLSFILFLPHLYASMCYQCASERAIMNWSRYRLPLSQDDSIVAHDSCLQDDRIQGHASCSGLCMTINITSVGSENDGKVLVHIYIYIYTNEI